MMMDDDDFEDNGVKTAVSTSMAHFSPLSSRRL